MFLFNAEKITTKNDFDFFVGEQNKFLNKTKGVLFRKYGVLCKGDWIGDVENYQKFRDEYKNLVHGILINVISEYRRFLPEKCLIVEFGSFAKGTERIFSDFDFTICYDEPKTEQYEVAEELIDYSLASIFEISVDKIHGKFQHYPDMPEMYIYTEEDNRYRLIFEDGIIDYKCGPETLNENLMHIKNVRDYQSMITGYEEKYKYKCNIDCLYSKVIIENTTEHDLFGDLAALEEKYDICDGYIFKLSPYIQKGRFQISEIKKLLKADGVVEFYIFISMLRKKVGFNSTYSMDISTLWTNNIILSTFGEEYVSRLRQAFTEFIFFFNRIEVSLNKRDIPLSTRCYDEFTLASINVMLAEDWGTSTDLGMVVGARNKLASSIQAGLSILKERV